MLEFLQQSQMLCNHDRDFISHMRAEYFPLTARELAIAGRALYGADWRGELAAALDLSDEKLIRAVEAGMVEAPGSWRARLIALAQDAALRAMQAASSLLWREEDLAVDTAAPVQHPANLLPL